MGGAYDLGKHESTIDKANRSSRALYIKDQQIQKYIQAEVARQLKVALEQRGTREAGR